MAPKILAQHRMQTLNAARQEVDQHLRSVQSQLRAEQRKPAQHMAKFVKSGKYKTMCCLMVLTHGHISTVQRFARVSGLSVSDLAMIRAQLTAFHGGVTDTPEEYYHRALASPDLRASMKKASTFLQEEKLDRWITETNVTKGLTPSSESVLLQLKRQVVHNPFAEVASLPPRKKNMPASGLHVGVVAGVAVSSTYLHSHT